MRYTATLTGLSRAQLLALIGVRDSDPTRAAIPAPVGEVDGDPAWRYDQITLWALRMGLHTYRGQRVIGYAGVAQMLGLLEQSVRKLVVVRARHIRDHGQAWAEDIPAPRWLVNTVVLFRRDDIERWAAQTGRLPQT